VARLEARIGTPLLHRTTRRLSLTEAGRRALAGAERILAAGVSAEAEAMAQAVLPRGTVRLAAPMSFGLLHVAPLLPGFFTKNPEVSVELHLSDDQVDVIGGGFDLAIRIAALADSSLKARRLCQVGRHLVGTRAYLDRNGRPTHPRDLVHHACLGYAYLPTRDRWHFLHASGEEAVVTPIGPLSANNADALTPAVLAGLGLAIQPDFVVWRDLSEQRLEVVMPDWSLPPIAVNLVSPPGSQRPRRVTALVDFLAQHLSSAPWTVVEPAEHAA
jgi:DNA-binding transcriptional LysR family regulator